MTVTNIACAIAGLDMPAAAISAMRSSLAVSAARPDSAARRGRAPVARSSERARSASRVAPQRCARSRPARSGSRASARWLARRSAAPSSTCVRASSSRPASPRASRPPPRSSAESPSSRPSVRGGDADAARQPDAPGVLELAARQLQRLRGVVDRQRQRRAPRVRAGLRKRSASKIRPRGADRVDRAGPVAGLEPQIAADLEHPGAEHRRAERGRQLDALGERGDVGEVRALEHRVEARAQPRGQPEQHPVLLDERDAGAQVRIGGVEIAAGGAHPDAQSEPDEEAVHRAAHAGVGQQLVVNELGAVELVDVDERHHRLRELQGVAVPVCQEAPSSRPCSTSGDDLVEALAAARARRRQQQRQRTARRAAGERLRVQLVELRLERVHELRVVGAGLRPERAQAQRELAVALAELLERRLRERDRGVPLAGVDQYPDEARRRSARAASGSVLSAIASWRWPIAAGSWSAASATASSWSSARRSSGSPSPSSARRM